ncbi:hypothetical protein HYPSUDRAFT_71025 [Hypholoma sublateritium FD-334 SS-4]|uniref:DUF6534 domain-containing protein n=1 Tax=Hypholoma sublateritium (strain FD-334 SS-4) TaxID=945553 RepID=A0A0D2NK22_HYPSF|nr:hypothetical protein HYPSUDRAFT_71025 [Hypholoma sublateritium FD-334 SS-4]
MGAFDSTLGAAFIGFFFSCVVFGMLTMQVFVYFQRFPKDRIPYKALRSSRSCGIPDRLLELTDQIFIGYSIYFYTVINYLDPTVFPSGKIIFCFTMRVWRFSKKNKTITGTIAMLILGEFGLAVAYAVKAFQLSVFDGRRLRVIASLALGGGLLTDLAIALALCVFLRKMRTGYRKADTLVNTLSIYAINTGALTGAVSLLTLLLYNCLPDTFASMASYFILGKLYAISFLATLNTRKVLRGKGTDTQGNSDGTNGTNNPRNTFFTVTNTGRPARGQDYSRSKSLEIDIRMEVSVIGDVKSAAPDVTMGSTNHLIPDHYRKM